MLPCIQSYPHFHTYIHTFDTETGYTQLIQEHTHTHIHIHTYTHAYMYTKAPIPTHTYVRTAPLMKRTTGCLLTSRFKRALSSSVTTNSSCTFFFSVLPPPFSLPLPLLQPPAHAVLVAFGSFFEFPPQQFGFFLAAALAPPQHPPVAVLRLPVLSPPPQPPAPVLSTSTSLLVLVLGLSRQHPPALPAPPQQPVCARANV